MALSYEIPWPIVGKTRNIQKYRQRRVGFDSLMPKTFSHRKSIHQLFEMSCVQDEGKNLKRAGLGSIASKVTTFIIFLPAFAPIIKCKDNVPIF